MGPGYWSSTFGVSPNNIYASRIRNRHFGLVYLLFLFWVSFIQGPRLLRADNRIYLVIVGLGFGFYGSQLFYGWFGLYCIL